MPSAEETIVESIFAHAGVGLCLLDAEDRLARANREWLTAAGLDEASALGRDIRELLAGLPPSLLALFDEARKTGTVEVPPHRWPHDEVDAWFEGRILQVPMPNSTGLLFFAADITERLAREQQLRASEQRWHAVLDEMLVGCQILGFDWRYLYVNEAAAGHGRRKSAELLGLRMTDAYPGIEETRLFRALQRCMVDRTSARFENEFTYEDGSTAWFDLSVQPHPDGLFIQSIDVTQRITSTRELLRVYGELEGIFQASPSPIIALDTEGKVLLWSRATERLFGWKASEVIGRKVPIVPEEKQPELAMLQEQATKGIGVVNEITYRSTRDGRKVPVSLSTSPLRTADGEHKGMVALLTDLTEQRALIEALVESERRFGAVFEASPVAKIVIRIRDRRVVEINRTALGLLRHTREEVVDKPASSLRIAKDEARFARFWDALVEGQVSGFELSFPDAAGGTAEVILSGEKLHYGGADYALVVIVDVTARRRAEGAVAASDQRFQQLAEAIEEVFWLTDTDKNRIIYVSPGYERIWGRPPESLAGDPRAWLAAIHPDDRERVLAAAMSKQALGTYDEEYRVVRPSGEIRWVRDKAFPVRDASGKVIRVAGTARDITAQRELEGQLRQNQKMESVGVLAGGVAHDFNNLLTVIAGGCEELGDMVADDAEASEILGEIREAGQRAASLTRQLLAFSRREVVEPRVVHIESVVLDAEKMLRRLLGEDVLLTVKLGRERLRVFVDPGSFVQALMNLSVNARDAMPRGGHLTIATARVMYGRGDPKPHALLRVIDDGEGMAPDVASRIFEPFFTTKPMGHGTGLGLSVVHGIVTQAGGHIEVSSRPGVGTMFSIYLPLADAEVEETSTPTANGATGGTETIFLVEDDRDIRRTAARALRKAGYSVLEASDGAEALKLEAELTGRIDLLVTDVVMPRLSGRELAEALRAKRPELRVLYTSGYTDDAVVRHGVRQSDVAFLLKPYDLAALRERVRALLDRPATAAPKPPTKA